MKPPVIPAIVALAFLITATALVLSEKQQDSAAPLGKPAFASVVTKKSQRPARIEAESPPARESVSPPPQTLPDESVSLDAWKQQLQSLLASGESHESAAAILARTIDQSFSAWVETEITAAAEMTGMERLDRLALAETQIIEGAALIYEQLEIPGGRRIEVAADALDSLAAEIQHADAAPDHATRLALLRLIRERSLRIDEASTMIDESAKTQALRETDRWYESRLGELATLRKDK